METDLYDDNWIDTDDDSIDGICDSENVVLLQKLVYKLKRERDEAEEQGYLNGWDACVGAYGIVKV